MPFSEKSLTNIKKIKIFPNFSEVNCDSVSMNHSSYTHISCTLSDVKYICSRLLFFFLLLSIFSWVVHFLLPPRQVAPVTSSSQTPHYSFCHRTAKAHLLRCSSSPQGRSCPLAEDFAFFTPLSAETANCSCRPSCGIAARFREVPLF